MDCPGLILIERLVLSAISFVCDEQALYTTELFHSAYSRMQTERWREIAETSGAFFANHANPAVRSLLSLGVAMRKCGRRVGHAQMGALILFFEQIRA